MSTDSSKTLPVLTESLIYDVKKVKKEPVEDCSQYIYVEVKEEPKIIQNFLIKQEPNEDSIDPICIKVEPSIKVEDFFNYNTDIKDEKVEIEENFKLVPKLECKHDAINNTDPNFLNIEGNVFKITVFDQNSQKNLNEPKIDFQNSQCYSCGSCKTNFNSISARDLHILNCVIRKNQISKKVKNLAKNDKEHSYGRTTLKCCICNATFLNKIKLHNHICGEIRENPYACEICQRQFSRKSCLKNHSKIHKYIPGRELANS